MVGTSPVEGTCTEASVFPPEQELERLEVERVEMIRQHLCQYTQLRHETDMFNQSVSSPPQGRPAGAPGDPGSGRATCQCSVAGEVVPTDESVLKMGGGQPWGGRVRCSARPCEPIPNGYNVHELLP